MYGTSVIMFSIMYCIPKFFELKVESFGCDNAKVQPQNSKKLNCSLEFDWRPTKLREDPDYILWYINIANLTITCVVPFVLLSFFNCKIYKSLKKRLLRRASMVSQSSHDTRNKEIRQTFVLFAIVALFVICHALRVILNVEELSNVGKSYQQRLEKRCVNFWAVVVTPLSTILLQINSSSSFFIYCFFDPIYRDLLKSSILRLPLVNTIQRATPSKIIQRFRRNKPHQINSQGNVCGEIELDEVD
jgi:hypothetical protein